MWEIKLIDFFVVISEHSAAVIKIYHLEMYVQQYLVHRSSFSFLLFLFCLSLPFPPTPSSFPLSFSLSFPLSFFLFYLEPI